MVDEQFSLNSPFEVFSGSKTTVLHAVYQDVQPINVTDDCPLHAALHERDLPSPRAAGVTALMSPPDSGCSL